MKKLYFTLLLPFVLLGLQSNAQCGLRYHDLIFNDSTVSNIKYGYNTKSNNTVDSLKLDLYFPKGDGLAERPLIMMAHGGNFLGGDKAGTDVLAMCQDLARMGYVVASINYRVGMTNFPLPGPDSTDATEAVMRAVHDGKAAVRFMRKSYQNGNPYRIDTSAIFFAGVSAGGFIGVQMAYLDNNSEFPSYIDTVGQPGLQGGLEGLSGNLGYSSKIHGVINICGAVGDTAWMSPGDEPILSFHGDLDGTVPYGSDIIVLLGFYPLLQVDGSYSIDNKADLLGIENCFETYEGQDHTPHVSNAAYYDTTLNITRNFLAHYVCGDALNCAYGPDINDFTSTEDLAAENPIQLYPNPTSGEFTIVLGNVNDQAEITMIDLTGKVVRTLVTRSSQITLSKENLPSGIYLVQVREGDVLRTTKLIVE